jgi:hypothetical protein
VAITTSVCKEKMFYGGNLGEPFPDDYNAGRILSLPDILRWSIKLKSPLSG